MTEGNSPAFSTDRYDPEHIKGKETWPEPIGLTKREFFAAMAMQGCVGREGHFYLYEDPQITAEDVNTPERYAQVAVVCADALIAELNKPK